MNNIIESSSGVLSNSLSNIEDLIQIKFLNGRKFDKIVLDVGAHVKNPPHFGNYLVLSSAFVLANRLKHKYHLNTYINFTALDNSPAATLNLNGKTYYKTMSRNLDLERIEILIKSYYLNYINELSRILYVDYFWKTYTDFQKTPEFKNQLFEIIPKSEEIRCFISPSTGVLSIRLICPTCGYCEKNIENTELVRYDAESAVLKGKCHQHGIFHVIISRKPNNVDFIDVNTLLRNLIKERIYVQQNSTLGILVKGGDWMYANQLIEGGHKVLKSNPDNIPLHLYTPQIISDNGNKLSKSNKQKNFHINKNAPPEYIDMRLFSRNYSDYTQRLVWITNLMMNNPNDFFRTYTTKEIGRILKHYSTSNKDTYLSNNYSEVF